MIYVNRELEKTIKPFLERPEALSVIGPRQAGKTTFIKYIAKNLTEQKNRKAGDSPVGVFEILWQGLFSRSPKPIV